MKHWLWLIAVAVGAPLAAQGPMADTVALVDTTRLRQHIERLGAEAMSRRRTPSPGLDTAAQYVADAFRKLGLRPGGDTASGEPPWIQRYLIPGQLQLDYAASRVDVRVKPLSPQPARRSPSVSYTLDFSQALRPASRVVRVPKPTWFSRQSPVVLVAGRHTPASIRQADLRDKIVLHVPASDADTATRQAVIDELMTLNGGLIIVADEDSVTFDQRRRAALERPVRLIEPYLVKAIDTVGWAVYAWANAMAGMLGDAGFDLARVRADTGQVIAALSAISSLNFQVRGVIDAEARTAPNVIGILDGTDTTLRKETVVISARLDHGGEGVAAGDNAAGIAGLIELARAFSHPAAHPRRRVVFIATSGGTSEPFGGATFFLESRPEAFWGGSRRGVRVVTNINVDLAGRPAADSVVVDGLADLAFRVRPDWIAAMYPELGLTVVDGGTVAQPRSDHFAFVRSGIPSVFVHHQHDASEEKGMGADATTNARILDFVFHVARDIANADQPLQWNAAGRRRWLGAIGQ